MNTTDFVAMAARTCREIAGGRRHAEHCRRFKGLHRLTCVGAILLSCTPLAGATAITDYAIYGEKGVYIGVGSTVQGMVGARNNAPGSGGAAIKLNGTASIQGDARSGGNVSLANNSHITGTLYRAPGTSLTLGSGASVGAQVVGDPQLPAMPPATPFASPTGGPNHSGANNATLTLVPGAYGSLTYGSAFSLVLDGAGDYFFDSIRATSGAKIILTEPGVRVFVGGSAVFGSLTILPQTLTVCDFSVEVHSNDFTNAFTAGGSSRLIGSYFAPFGGLHIGSGSGAGASFLGTLIGQHVDLEHGVQGTYSFCQQTFKASGSKVNDANGNCQFDPTEELLPGWIFFVDYNDDTQLDPATEPWAETGPDGRFVIEGIQPGTWKVREIQQTGWESTCPANGAIPVNFSFPRNWVKDLDFGNRRIPPPPAKLVISGHKHDAVTQLPLNGWRVFLDLNGSGQFDDFNGQPEPNDVTHFDSNGGDGTYVIIFELPPVPVTFNVIELPQPGWTPVDPPTGAHTIQYVPGVTPGALELNFSNRELCLDIDSYVLLALDSLNFKGGNNVAQKWGYVLGGNVGVNNPDLNPNDGAVLNVGINGLFVMSPGSRLVGDSIWLGNLASVFDVFVNHPFGPGWGKVGGSLGTFPPPIFNPFPHLAGPFAPGTADVVVPKGKVYNNGTPLPPGAYRDIMVQNGGTLHLTAGTYTVRRFVTGQQTKVFTVPGTVIEVRGDGNGNSVDFGVGDNGSYFGSADPNVESVAKIYVDEALANNSVNFGRDGGIVFWGEVIAPNATINLGGRTITHYGRFIGRTIGSDWNVNIHYRGPCYPP